LNAIAAAQGHRIVSVSDDKSLRIWNADSGRLLSIVHVPQAAERNVEGQLIALATSPDGRFAATAGYTRSDKRAGGEFCIYVVRLDVPNPQIVARLDGFDRPVIRLEFSEDGRHLAVVQTIGASAPLRVIDWNGVVNGTGSAPPTSISMPAGDRPLSVDFTPEGDLVVVTVGARLLRANRRDSFRVVAEAQLENWSQPSQLVVSPDGRRIAIGNDTEPSVLVVDSLTLATIARVTLPKDDNLQYVRWLAWQRDSSALMLGGGNQRGTGGAVSYVDLKETQRVRRVLTLSRRVSFLMSLEDGRFAYASAEPGMGVLDPTGSPVWRWRAPVAFPPTDSTQIRLNGDGYRAALVRSGKDGQLAGLQVDLLATGPGLVRQIAALPPEFDQPHVRLESWSVRRAGRCGDELYVGTERVALDPGECNTEGSWAAGPKDDAFFLGTYFWLRKVDRSGNSVWKTPIPAEAYRVDVSGNGALVAAWLVDGTIQWFRAEDGGHIASLLVMNSQQEWILWIPSGYYTSSPLGDNYFGWAMNRPETALRPVRAGAFFKASQFERFLFRPDVVSRFLRSRGTLDLDSILGASSFRIAQLESVLPPDVALEPLRQDAARTPQDMTRVRVTASGSALPILDWNLFVNDIPVLSRVARTQALGTLPTREFVSELSVPRLRQSDLIRLEVSNGRAFASAELQSVGVTSPVALPKRRLYVAAIGASRFDDERIAPLRYAGRDATAMVEALRDRAVGYYDQVETLLITDQTPGTKPTGANIRKYLGPFVRQAGVHDTVIVFVASHGLSDPAGSYHFVPSDGSRYDIDLVQRGSRTTETLLPWQYFLETLSDTAGQRVLIVDTCAAAAIEGSSFDSYSLAKRSTAAKFALLAASTGTELSQESERHGHGLFTFGLLDALRRGIDLDADGVVSLDEAFEHARDLVESERNRATGPQTPTSVVPESLSKVPLGRATSTPGSASAAMGDAGPSHRINYGDETWQSNLSAESPPFGL